MDETVKTYDATFQFLATRKYVHGTSLTNQLQEICRRWELPPIHRLTGVFHKPLLRQGTYVLAAARDDLDRDGHEYNSTFTIYTDGGTYYAGVLERDEAVAASTPYDEDGLVNRADIRADNGLATIKSMTGEPTFNIIVALNKRLLLQSLPREGYGQWFLGGYDLKWSNIAGNAAKQINLKLLKVLNGLSTRTEVTIDGQKDGYIYFARGVAK